MKKSLGSLLAVGVAMAFSTNAFANNPPHQIRQNHIQCGNAYCQNQYSPPPIKMIAISVDSKTGVYAVASGYGNEESVSSTASNSCNYRKSRSMFRMCEHTKTYQFGYNTADQFGHAVIVRGINPDIPPNKKYRYGFAFNAYITKHGQNMQSYEQSLLQSCQAQGWEQCQIVFHNNDRQW